MDNKLPNLVNLNEDPQLSEMLLYVLKEGLCVYLSIYLGVYKFICNCITGETTVGRHNQSDIQLTGALVAKDHW